MDIELPNISNYKDIYDLPYILFGALTIDVIVIFFTRYYKLGNKELNEWYDKFNILAVTADVMVIVIGILIARYIYTYYLFDQFGWSPIFFLVLLIGVQLIHDVLFYYSTIKPMPYGHNEMIDLFKKYSERFGVFILPADSILTITSASMAILYKYMPDHIFALISSIVVYALPYILFTRNPYMIEEVKKEEKEEKPVKQKIDAFNRLM